MKRKLNDEISFKCNKDSNFERQFCDIPKIKSFITITIRLP